MTWSGKSRQNAHSESGALSSGQLQANEVCYIRKGHKCGKIFSASKSCFVACPSDGDIDPLLSLIREKAAKHGIDTVVAIKERVYGQDIFCTKICGKIIESRFCLVILDDSSKDGVSTPNPNVYYEYGLMTSMNKHIIPLQKEGLKLAFNIQSYDTVKYCNSSMDSELERAIRDAIMSTGERRAERAQALPEKTIERSFEISGFTRKANSDWVLGPMVEDTGFVGYELPESKSYAFVGKIDSPIEFEDYLSDTMILSYRIEKKRIELEGRTSAIRKMAEDYKADTQSFPKPPRNRFEFPGFDGRNRHYYGIEELEESLRSTERVLEKLKEVILGFIIDPSIDSSRFISDVEESLEKSADISAVFGNHEKIAFGDFEVEFISSQPI